MGYIKKKKKKNKEIRDLVTGLLHVIGPQISRVQDDKAHELFREMIIHLNKLSIRQIEYAVRAIEDERKKLDRPAIPRQFIFEDLRKEWYEKK